MRLVLPRVNYEEYKSDDLEDEYEGPNVNRGRFGRGNGFREARFGNRWDDNLGNIKVKIIPF